MNSEIVDKIAAFLQSIGLELIMRPIGEPTFLPGLLVENGKIIADPEKLLYPGDILHEAGHLAAIPSEIRKNISYPIPEIYLSGGYEMSALAWSYAACLYIGMEPSVVFHEEGYRGQGNHIAKTFAEGNYIGLNMLQYMGLAYDKKKSEELNILPYPNMVHWLRQN